jgi:hypothetical protein
VALFAVVALAAECSASASASASIAPPTRSGSVTGPLALGVNMAAWDSLPEQVDSATLTALLNSAGLGLIRYPGGSWADEYDWSENTDSSHCTGSATAACTAADPLDFGELSAQARSAGASTFVTVNYGSGTPSEAAAWVTRASTTQGEEVALWEVGNETYSCHENNEHLAGAPTFTKGYTTGGSVCPSTAAMARSYAANVVPYFDAMKKADPAAKIGVPWAFSGTQAAGASVKNPSLWNAKVLRAVKADVGFVDAHWYPYDRVRGVSDQQVVLSTRRIPAAASQIRSTLHREAPGAAFVVGETNISERLTTLDFKPVSALFAAATSLTWLSQGAESVDWWDLNNFGSPTRGDYGMLSSGGPESEPVGTPLPPYFGELLASNLTRSGSHVRVVGTGSKNVLGFTSELGQEQQLLLVNTAPSRAVSVADRWFTRGSALETLTYSASTADTASPIVRSTTTAGRRLALPTESIVVLSGTSGS